MDLGLSAKRVAVMAASEGLGRAAAEALAREGARVAIGARRREPLEAAAKEIGAECAIVSDYATPDGPRAFVDEAARRLGGLDALVFNAGGPPPGRFDKLDDAAWESAFQLVTMSYVRSARAAIPHFRAAGAGSVVAIESTSVKQPIENLVLSAPLRAAVIALSKALANEHAKERIRFNVVLPGSMATERIRELVEDRAREQGIPYEQALADRTAAIPMARLGEPAELGRVIAFLSSPAASYVTGVVLQVDGGSTKGVY